MFPLEMGTRLLWNVTVLNANYSSLYNRGIITTDIDSRKKKQLPQIDCDWRFFLPVALEVNGSSGEKSKFCITRLGKMLWCLHDDLRTASFLERLMSMVLPVGYAEYALVH